MSKMMKKKSLAAVLALVVMAVFVFTGCGSSSKGNVLRVGMEVGYPPMEMVGDDGKTVEGFDVDVANELAKRLGYTGGIEIVQTAWDGIFSAVETDKFDVIISAVSINDERQAAHSLTNAYVANKLVIVTKKGDTSITKPEDLVGKKVGVQGSTTAEEYLKTMAANGTTVEYSPYQKVTQPFSDLKIGRLDAVVVDVVVAGYYLVQDKESFDVVWENDVGEPMALCFAKKNTELRDKANEAIKAMQADGTMAKISEKWFAMDITSGLE
ncbi:MAG: transporter substrate-binding domain-containing protein [Clostridiales bacterium]|nr:transporter substrate-binding domain-containing protein [Clostridiales bacterium]